ncbi:hypothetical protein Hypma_012330 [Hypsizygus marmoreus]|uniref:Uncharacterized protein n=1 Tax=Hypsizygus marmoreus TaxID=39966 RepID=A0A369IZ10_HYPMA|nr:hypothetical protein Hypma_016133 [Hypsizygus marmoreus]RDB30148.1 hypothetical protein Hypma_012330 [Hypsizygus marmoreus]
MKQMLTWTRVGQSMGRRILMNGRMMRRVQISCIQWCKIKIKVGSEHDAILAVMQKTTLLGTAFGLEQSFLETQFKVLSMLKPP